MRRPARPTCGARGAMNRSIVLFTLVFIVSCGQVSIEAAGGADTASDTPAPVDGTGDIGLAGDVTPDAPPQGDECETDYDCLGLAGKSACKLPHCSAGSCVLAVQPVGSSCLDSSVVLSDCTAARCSAEGTCTAQSVPDGQACGLGTCGKKCASGQCIPATDADYDDANPCTKDFCDQGIQVRHLPITDLAIVCDDGDACTAGDTCVQGACAGQKQDCSDGILCTQDGCDSKQGCTHKGVSSLCDSSACAVMVCDLATGCTATGIATGQGCDDGDACTAGDTCSVTGACSGTPTCACTADSDCKNTNLCLGAPTCVEGKCVSDPTLAVQCDTAADGPCVKTECDPVVGQCKAKAAADGKACDDGDACTTSSVCGQGKCTGQGALACDDKNGCTADSCSPVTGCVHTPTGGACEDGNACTQGDTCVSGGCVGAAGGCDDQVSCTLDACDPTSGKCSHKANVSLCDDGNPCTSETCDLVKGCVSTPDDAAKCSDGDACTVDTCQAGKCASKSTCQCKTDTDCDDKNPCTADTCGQGKCEYATAGLDGKACDTGDKCQQPLTGTCGGGGCKTGNKPVDCSAKADACNSAACDPGSGQCETVAKTDGTGCDADGNGCTVGDACQAGKCKAGAAADCASSGNACNSAACKSSSASQYACVKQPLPATTPCQDGKFCTSGDACDGQGACVAGGPKSCADVSTPCNPASCSEAEGKCVQVAAPVNIVCDDGLFCTTGDHCDGKGGCAGGKALACPGGVCLIGACNEGAKACTSANAQAGAPCEDGNACTSADSCDSAGQCKSGATKACSGDACNDGVCDKTTGTCGVTPRPTGTPCSDGQPCTLNDVCAGGTCLGGPTKTCDGDACHDGVCDAATGSCGLKNKADGASCSDGNACTAGDKCASGSCAGTYTCACKPATQAADCNDQNACTVDTCPLIGGVYKCSNAASAGSKCDDGNPCTASDACTSSGACNGTAVVCNDSNGCTLDSCSNGACVYKPNPGLPCSDGNACTAQDACSSAGSCVGNAVNCDDGKACTDDSCDSATGACKHGNNVAPCTDGNACTVNDTCSGGQCAPGKSVSCDDGNACTSDACDPVVGTCSHAANSAACSDGNACTQNDVCSGGQCKPGASVVCNDGNGCTDDACDTATGLCKFANNAAPCSDGNGCTLGDACKYGTCYAGAAKSCSDGNVCTNDGCDAGSGMCTYVNNASACSDGNACTVSDVCSGGQCAPGAAANCNDGNNCTVDGCSALVGCTNKDAVNGAACGPKQLCSKFPLVYATPKCYAGTCEPAECFF
jgi:hypothetical protein